MAISGPGRSLSSSPGRRIVALVPLVVAIDALLVVAVGLLPLTSVSGLRCDAVLRGGEAKPDPTLAGMIAANKVKLCHDASHGRVVVMVVVGLLVLLLGIGSILAPSDRLERFLARRGEDDRIGDAEGEAALEAAHREAGEREERGRADALREARARAAAEDRSARVAKARAARLEARARPTPAKPARRTKVTKEASKATTSDATTAKRSVSSKKAVATRKGGAAKKVVTAKKAVTAKSAKKAGKVTRPMTGVRRTRANGGGRVVTTRRRTSGGAAPGG